MALREVRECLQSLNSLLTKAEGSAGGIVVNVQTYGDPPRKVELETDEPKNPWREPQPIEPAAASRAALPPAASATEASGQSTGFAIMPLKAPRRIPLTNTGAAMAFLRGRGSR